MALRQEWLYDKEADVISYLARELHMWRLMHVTPNRLVRRADRVETAMLTALAIAAVAAFVVILTIGGTMYASMKADEAHREPLQRVQATVVATSARAGAATTVRWTTSTGAVVTGRVSSSPFDKVGRARQVFLNDSGEPVTPAHTGGEAVITSAGMVVLLAVVWWLLARGLRRLMDRLRYREWDAEWRDLDIDTLR